MEKKSSIKEVHKLVQQDYPELYKKITGILGDNTPFAKFSIGAGNYIWSDNRCNWHQMIAWSSMKQEAVKEALAGVRANFSSQFGERQTELLFSVPDDGYIFFNDDDGDIRILLTGWGFKKPVRIPPKPIIVEIVNKNPVTIAFIYGGTRLPNYQFGLRHYNKVRKLHTEADGLFHMGNLGTGERYIIYDIQNNNNTYNLEIVDGQSHYDIDLTKYTLLNVSAFADEQSVCNEQIEILYHGAQYNVVTDTGGHAILKLPLYEDENLSATLRDQTKSTNIHAEGNHIDFVFQTPPPPIPVVETDVLVTVMIDGAVCPNHHITINYNGQTYNGETDEKGQFVQHLLVSDGELCNVSADDYTSQQRELSDSSINEFRFEKNTPPIPPEPPVPSKIVPTIIVKRENGDVVGGYPVTVEANGESNQYITDVNGRILLPEIPENETITVMDGNNQSYVEEYIVTSEQEEYIFIIPDEEPVIERQLKLMFRDKQGKPIKCNGVSFHQEGSEDVNVTLDENGDTYLPKDTFKTGEKITASISGWEENYDPIPFVTDENEYDYLLQEKSSTKSWWMILFQILAVLITIVSVTVLWPYFEAFAAGVYKGIY